MGRRYTARFARLFPLTTTGANSRRTDLQTRALGLSLGDRACLALAVALNAPVYTADRTWKKLKLGTRIHVIR